MSDENVIASDDYYALKDIDLYSVLCITKETYTIELVKKKYRRLVLKYHPDKNPGEDTTNKQKLIQLAYSILSNETKKALYDQVRDSDVHIEDYRTMKRNAERDEINIPAISEEEFVRRMREKDQEIDEDYRENQANKERNKGKMTDEEAQLLMKRNNDDLLTDDMKEKFQTDYNKLNDIKDKDEKAKAFNAMFETMHVGDEDVETQDLMLYNGNTTLMDVGIASTNNYDSMFYQGTGTYEDAFKINNLKEELDERSLEEQMAEYEAQTAHLNELARQSTLKNGRADFRFDHTD